MEMSSPNENSDDESILRTPPFLASGSRISEICPEASTSKSESPIMIYPISQDVLEVWKQLPEAIRLDPSLAVFRKKYERVQKGDRTRCTISAPSGEFLVLNMTLSRTTGENLPKLSFEEEEGEEEEEGVQEYKTKLTPFFRYSKLFLLVCCWLIFTAILITKREVVEVMHQVSVPSSEVRNYIISQRPVSDRLSIIIESSLLPHISKNASANSTNYLTLWLESWDVQKGDSKISSFKNDDSVKNISEPWILPLLPPDLIDISPTRRRQKIFLLKEESFGDVIAVKMRTNLPISLPLSFAYNLSPINTDQGLAYGAAILIGLYILIMFEVVHRAIAAMLASTMSLAVLAVMDNRPTMNEVISWIDIDTLLLLFSMMILVAVIAETGTFDYLAVYAYKITGGKVWPLVSTLCFFTAIISTVLDNVTTVLLMTPVAIRLCEVMQINPIPILTSMVIYSNIGGTLTPVGDPPNVIIVSNRDVINAGIGFSTFVLHMSIGVFLVVMVVYAQIRFIFRDTKTFRFNEPLEVQDLRHEIAIWQRAAASLSSCSKDENLVRETLMKKVRRLLSRLKLKLTTGSIVLENYKNTLEELQKKYPIRDKWLLAKSGFVLAFVIVLFFIHSLPNVNLSLGWIALVGVLLLLVLADAEDFDGLMARVEWSTLLFFAALFILMEALARLGLMAWIGKQTEALILSVNEESRLAVAILLILWVSAIVSAFVDNVPLCTMMVRIATGLAQNHELGLPLQPLIWALAFGSCMGGNGTLIGATANVVCAGVAEQHGYKFTFFQFFKVGFPIMITSIVTITVYLMVVHVLFQWHDAV